MLRGSRLVALVAAACCCTVSDALLLGPHPPCHRRVAASTAGRVRSLRCEEASPMPEEVAKNIPPEMLAAAWEREEEAKELSKLLKGCQVHHCTACTTPPLELAPSQALARCATGISTCSRISQAAHPLLLPTYRRSTWWGSARGRSRWGERWRAGCRPTGCSTRPP